MGLFVRLLKEKYQELPPTLFYTVIMERILFLSTKRRPASWMEQGEQPIKANKLPVASGKAWLQEMNTLIRLKKEREEREITGAQ